MISEFVAGYEGYWAVAICMFAAYLAFKQGEQQGVRLGIEATLAMLVANRAIKIKEDSTGEQIVTLPDNTPVTMHVKPK